MKSLKLWHFGMTAFVVITLVSLSITHIFSDDMQWEQVSAKGLQQKISVGLEQIYWQWQNEGRPDQILYLPENAKRAVKINIREDGKPDFIVSIDTCIDFLGWFVQDVSLKRFVEVSVTQADDSQSAINASKGGHGSCGFTMAKHRFFYDLQDAQIHN